MTNGSPLTFGLLLGSAPDNVSLLCCFHETETGYLERAHFSSSSGEASFLRVTCGGVSKYRGAVVGQEDPDGDWETNVEEGHVCW